MDDKNNMIVILQGIGLSLLILICILFFFLFSFCMKICPSRGQSIFDNFYFTFYIHEFELPIGESWE